MRPIVSLLVACVLTAGVVAIMAPVSGHADGEAKPVFVTTILPGYRDWQFISVAQEEGNLHSFAAVLGNDVAVKAYREGKLPYPDGAIIAALHFPISRQKKTTKSLARLNLLFPGHPQTLNSWSRIQQSMPLPVAGDLVISTQATANLPLERL